MIRLYPGICLAAVAAALVACAEPAPTNPDAGRPASAAVRAGDVVAMAKPLGTASCTVTQVDATHFDATATWKNISAVSVEFLQGTTVLAVTQFTHPKKNGSLTVTLSVAPDNAIIAGSPVGAKVLCTLS